MIKIYNPQDGAPIVDYPISGATYSIAVNETKEIPAEAAKHLLKTYVFLINLGAKNELPAIDQTLTVAPVVEESTNGDNVDQTPSIAPVAPVAPEEDSTDDIVALRAKYEKETKKKLSPRFRNNIDWIKSKIL